MGFARQSRRLRKKLERAAAKKHHRKAVIEALEPRLLLSADLSYTLTGSSPHELTLLLSEVGGVDTLQLIDNNDLNPSTRVLAQRSLADTDDVRIEGSSFDDSLIIDFTNPFSKNIFFEDAHSDDNDTLKVIGDAVYPLNITAENTGTITNGSTEIAYSGIETLRIGELSNFVNLDAERLEDVTDQFTGWLSKLTGAENFDIEIPFVDGSFADVLDFGTAFEAAVLSKIDFDNIETLQDFATEMTKAGLVPAGETVSYDPVTKSLTIPVEFELDLDAVSLRDLDELGLLELEMLADGGLIQIGPYADPDTLLDEGYTTIEQLGEVGLLDDAILDWDEIDTSAIREADLIGAAALEAEGFTVDSIDMDRLIDSGLVTLGDLADAGFITIGSVAGNLGFIRDINLMATNVADLGLDLASQASVEDLVDLDGLLSSGLTTLEDLFDQGLVGLGDIGLDSLDIDEIITAGIASLEDLVDQGLVTAADLLSSALVDITNLVTQTSATLSDLINQGLINASDFAASTAADAATLFSGGIADLRDAIDEELVVLNDFTDITLSAAGIIAAGLATQFQLDYNDLDDGLGNVSLHALVNSGVTTLQDLLEQGLVSYTNLATTAFSLADLLRTGITDLAELVNAGLVEMGDLAINSLDLQGLLDSGLVTLTNLVESGLVGLADLGLNEIDIPGLIESGLADLGDLARESFIGSAQMAVDELLASEIATEAASLFADIQSQGGLIGSGSIIDLDELLANMPITLSHLIYFGIIDHNDIRPLGTVDRDELLESSIIDRSVLERNSIPEIVEAGYLSMADLAGLDLISRGNIADLPPAALDLFGFSRAVQEELDGLGYIVQGDSVDIDLLEEYTNLTLADLLTFGIIDEGDLKGDLTDALLDDIFVQGEVNKRALLESDVLEQALLESYITQDGDVDVVAVTDLITNNLATLDELIDAGVLTSSDVDWTAATVSEGDLLATGLITQAELDAHALVEAGQVELEPLVVLGLVSLSDLARHNVIDSSDLATVNLELNELLASNVVGENDLAGAGLGDGDEIDIETLLAATFSGGVTLDEDDLIQAGLTAKKDFYKGSAITLKAMVQAGLVDASALITDSTVSLEDLCDSDAVAKRYIDDEGLADSDGYILIEDLLADSYLTFEDLVTSTVLRPQDFVNKVFDLEDLEAATIEGEPLFEANQLDGIVHVGTVALSTLLDSILFDKTLYDYVQQEFVDLYDFDNIDINVSEVESAIPGLDLGLAEATVKLYSLIAMDEIGVNLLNLIYLGFVDRDDLTDPDMELDIVELEDSILFEDGDLNNYISGYTVYLHDLVNEAYIGDLVTLGFVDVDDLIIRNLGDLSDMVDDGVLDKNDFQNAALDSTGLVASGLVTDSDLNTNNLVREGDVSLYNLLGSGLVSLKALIDAGLVDGDDLSADVKARKTEKVLRSDVLDLALLLDAALITEASLDEDPATVLVPINGTGSLLDSGLVSFEDLVVSGVVDPSRLDPAATVDKDLLVSSGLITPSGLINAGLVSPDDLLNASVDLKALNDTGALSFSQLENVDLLVSLDLISEAEADTFDPDYFGLNGRILSLAGDYGADLVGLISEVEADIQADVSAQFDIIIDFESGGGDPTKGDLSWRVADATATGSVSFDASGLDVPARLGFIGVELGGEAGTVDVDMSASVILDRDGDDGTTNDRTFTLEELGDAPAYVLRTALTGDADASLQGITVNTGLGGLGVASGALFLFSVDDLSRSRNSSDYVTLDIQNLPEAFQIYEYLRLDDLMSEILRGRNYIFEALDQLPFWVTDPNSPLYDLVADVTIPLINKTPRELLGFLTEIEDAVNRAQRALLDPENDIQKLVSYVMDSLGLDMETDSDIFSVTVDEGVLRMRLALEKSVEEDVSFDFDLGVLTDLAGGIDGLEGIEELVGLEGSGSINFKAFAGIVIEAGVDASGRLTEQPVDVFLYDYDDQGTPDTSDDTGTRVDAGFKLLGQGLNLGFEIFDSIGLDVTDGTVTIDADGDPDTNPELIDPDDHSDFVTVSFVLDQQAGTGVTDDGKYSFDETLIGDNVDFTGVTGRFDVSLPLTLDIFGTETTLTDPLWIRTNPVYGAEGLEQLFLHLFDASSAGAEDPVLIDAPDITDELGNLANSVIRGLLEDLAGFIATLKDQFINTGFLDLEIPGTGRTIGSYFEDATVADSGLAGFDEATGFEAFLDIDRYVFAYLETINWVGTNSVADGGVSVSDIWTGLADFLKAHWMITLPGIGSQGSPGFFTVDSAGDELNIAVDIPYTISDTIPIDLGTDLGAVGLELDAAMDFAFDIATGLSFDFTVDLAGENSSFNFNEFYFDASASANDIDLGISYEDTVELTTHVGTDYGDAAISIGGSIYQEDGEFTFNHEQNKDGTITFDNSVSLYLPLTLVIGGGGVELGSISFADTDFYDGELDPGFSADLREIGGILEEAAYLVLDMLGEEIEGFKGDLLPIYDTDGSVISEGNEYLTMTIPGTDISLDRILGLESLLDIGLYIRHYLRPQLDTTGFERDASIPLGQEAEGEDYYGAGDPTIGGFFDYLQENWIPTLGGEGGGLSWDPIMDDDDIVGVDVSFIHDYSFERIVGLNFGEQAESIGLTIDGDMELNVEVDINLELSFSFNWLTDETSFAVDNLSFDGHASIDDIVVGAAIGPLSVSLGKADGRKGVLALDLGAQFSYDSDSGVTFNPTLNTDTEHNNYIDVQLPVYASLGDVTFGESENPPQLSLSGTIFPSAGGPALAFSQENMDQLLDFSDFNIGSLISIIQSTLDWLGGLTDNDFMQYEVPIINRDVGELFDFASSFADKMSALDYDRINSVQDFIEQFSNAGILPEGLDVVYDAANRTLSLPVNFDFNFSDLNLRNLANMGDFSYEKLLDLGAINPSDTFDKDTILDGLLGILETPLDELARWELIDIDFFNAAKTITISSLEDLELIEEDALPGTSITLGDLLSSEAVNVTLEDLFNVDLLSAADFLADKKIDYDDLIASRLITSADLAAAGVSFYRWTDRDAGTFEDVDEPQDADFVNLSDLINLQRHSLDDAVSMGFLSQDEFDLAKVLNISALESAGLISAGALDSLGSSTISLSDLLDSDLVSVELSDLITNDLIGRSDLTDLASVAAENLSFEGFDLYDMVDLGMLSQGDIVDFSYDLLDLKDVPIDLGFDLGDALELGTSATADVKVTVEAGFEWVIDFDGPTGEEGITFLINNAHVGGKASLDVNDLEFLAKLGFIKLTAGGEGTDSGVHLFAEATLTLDEDGNIETEDDREFSFTDLISGGLFDNLLFDFTGYGEARLKGLDISPNIPGLDETGLNEMEVSITIPDLLNWDDVEVITQGEATEAEIDQHLEQDHVVIIIPNFSDAFNVQDMDFASIIEAIRTGVEFIESALEGTSFYSTEIPIINRRIDEAFEFVDDLLEKVELAAEDPAAALQEVEDIIEGALGITDPDAFALSLDGQDVLKLHIEWEKILSDLLDEDYMNLNFAFNLGEIIGMFGGEVGSGWDFINELVSGGADISWDAFVEMTVEIGIDFSDIMNGNVDFFLYDYDDQGTATVSDDTGTRVSIGVKVEGTGLELMFNPFGIGVTGGSAYLGVLSYDNGHNYYTTGAEVTSADFATFTLGIDQQTDTGDDGRFYLFSEDIEDNFTYDLVGGFDIYLPVEIPGFWGADPVHVYTNSQPSPGGWGDGALLEAFRRLAGSGSETPEAIIVDLPDLSLPDFSLLSILNDPSYILDGVDFCLGAVEDVLDMGFVQDIPLVGDKLGGAADFLGDIRTGFLADLREKLDGPGKAIEFMRDSIWDVFGPDKLNIIRDSDGDGTVELEDIHVGWYDAGGNLLKVWEVGDEVPTEGDGYDADADAIQFEIPLGGVAFGTGIDIPLDIDLPGFGLQVDGGFAVELDWSFDFGMGLSLEDGFYLTTNDDEDPEIEVEVGAFLDGEPLNNAVVTPFYAEGKLLFFKLTAADMDREPETSGFQPSGLFGFLEIDITGDEETGRLTFNRVLSSPIEDIFDIDFGLDAALNLELELSLGDVRGLPKLAADLVGSWGWSFDEGATDPEFGLDNLRLEVGSFVTDVLKPITDNINDILSPFEPVVDVLLTEVSGLDVLVDPPNLLGLINLIARMMGYSELPEEFFTAVKSMIDISQQVDAMIGTNGEILLGSIAGLGTGNVSATQASGAFPDELQNFLDRINSDSTGGGGPTGVQSGGSSTERSGFEIVDYILDISNWMKLITGGDAILFTYEMPYLEYELNFRQSIATITAGPAVINVYAVGGFDIGADLGFGYDTFGVKKAIKTGNAWDAFDGFYIADWGITSGKEKDELTFGLEIGLEATLWLALIEAGLGGVVGFEAGLDLQDINDDGRIRISELATMWDYTGNDAPGGLLNIINLDGRVYFEAYVFVDVGISIPLVGKIMSRVVDWTIFDITLAEWEYNAPKVQPVLAHEEGDTLVIHSGKRAGDREYLDTKDGGEQFTFTGDASSITVAYDEWSWTYEGSFSKVIADGGAGKDVFDASGLTGVAVEFDGGEGDDQLTASVGAAATMTGGAGNDTLNAAQSTGAVSIDGGEGDDRITGGTAATATNTLIGGDGDDRITGGAGDDLIDGGPGNDTINGMDGIDTYTFAEGFGSDRFSDRVGETTVDFSGVSSDMTVYVTNTGITINTAGEELRLGNSEITHLILGTGNDTIFVSNPPERTIVIEDAGGANTYIFELGKQSSTKADGIIEIVDNDTDFDEVIFKNIPGIELNDANPDILTFNDHEIRNGREVIRFTDDVEKFTLVVEESEIAADSTTTFHPADLTIISTDPAGADMGATDLYIHARNLTIKPETDGGFMHFAGDDIVIEVVEDVILDTSVHATGDFDITADSIGAQYGSAHPLVIGSADAVGTIEHEIDAHDMDWHIRVSSLEVNVQLNAINDGRLDIYTANAAAQAYIDLHADITSGSGDNRDNLGGGTMRFVAEGTINLYDGMRFLGAGSHLVLAGDNLYNHTYAGSNKIETTVGGLTFLTREEGVEAGSEIVVEETDSLVVYGLTDLPGAPDSNPVGLSSAHGTIDITLFGTDAATTAEIARLTLDSGSIITRDPGKDISFTADDFDFLSAPAERDTDVERPEGGVIGTGNLTILTSYATDFLLGTAAEHELGTDWIDIYQTRPTFKNYPDHVGGNFSGPEGEETYDDDDSLFINTVHLSTRDLSAFKDGFTLITIGDGTTEKMIFGDAMDADIIKKDGSIRDRDSSFRDDVVFNADKIYIEGEVEAQDNDLVTVEMNTERLHVKSKNINNPLGGTDSGITGDILDLYGITNRMIVDGWVKTNYGDIMVDIQGNGESYMSPMMEEAGSAKRMNNFIQGVAGILETNKDGGVIEIVTKNSVVMEGRSYVQGEGARISVMPGTFFELVQIAGAMYAPGAESLIEISAPEAVYINGEILAGVEWQGGVKVPVAEGADVVITTPHELRIFGAISTTDIMELTAGTDQDYNERDAVDASIHLTGQLSSYADNSLLRLEGPDDVIIEGSIFVRGENSGLLIDSDQRVKFATSFVEVEDSINVFGRGETQDLETGDYTSVFVDATAVITSFQNGSDINITGTYDVDILGSIVAGGSIGPTGVTWSGTDSEATILAGEQVYLDSGVLASDTVSLIGGAAGEDDVSLDPDNTTGLSVVVTTAGGLTAAGRTSDGSHGLAYIFGESGVEMMGHIYSGANKSLLFDAEGNLIKESIDWETSVGGDVNIESPGQVFIGGWAENERNQVVLTGDVDLYFEDNLENPLGMVTVEASSTEGNERLGDLISDIQDALEPVFSGSINVQADDDRVVFTGDTPFTLSSDSISVDLLGLAGGDNVANEVVADAEYTAPTAYASPVGAEEVTLVVNDGNGDNWGQITFTVEAGMALQDLVDLLNQELDNSVLNDFRVASDGGSLVFTNAYDFEIDDASVNLDVLGMTDVSSGTVASDRAASTYEIRAIQSLFGDVLVTGGYIAAKDEIHLRNVDTTEHPYTGPDIGVRIQGSSDITTHEDYSSINIDSKYDAEIEGHLIAGGEVENIRDAETGGFIGSVYNDFGVDAAHTEISINAEHQVRIGTTLKAGALIKLTGGDDPFEGDPNDIFNFTDSSVLVYGSALIETWGENSRIILDGPDKINVLTPTHFHEIEPDTWVKGDMARIVAEGQFMQQGYLPVDVDLHMWKRVGTTEYEETISIKPKGTNTSTAAPKIPT